MTRAYMKAAFSSSTRCLSSLDMDRHCIDSRSRDLWRRPKAAIYGRRRPKATIGETHKKGGSKQLAEGAFSYLNWRLCTGSCSAGSTRPDADLRPPSIAAFGRSRPLAAVDRGSRPSAAAADRGIENRCNADPYRVNLGIEWELGRQLAARTRHLFLLRQHCNRPRDDATHKDRGPKQLSRNSTLPAIFCLMESMCNTSLHIMVLRHKIIALITADIQDVCSLPGRFVRLLNAGRPPPRASPPSWLRCARGYNYKKKIHPKPEHFALLRANNHLVTCHHLVKAS